MADDSRTCRRPGCAWPADASLSYRYATRQVWLLDLSPSAEPALYDLCASHADALTVPRGWERVDERSVPAHRPRMPGRETTTRAGAPAQSVPLRSLASASRYERLSQELPGLAARLAEERQAGATREPRPARVQPRRRSA